MTQIAFSCPRCGRSYQVEAQLAGKKARCKDCQEVMRVPLASPPEKADSGDIVLSFPCPRCGHGFRLDPTLAGKKARCKQCGEVFRVPSELPTAGAKPTSPAANRFTKAYDLIVKRA